MIITITGPSGSGKTTLVNMLREHWQEKIYVAISDTTRYPRDGEVDGVDYRFVSLEVFNLKLQNNLYLETIEFKGNYYGYANAEFACCERTPVIAIVEPSGVVQLEKRFGNVIKVFLDVPDEIRIERMKVQRGEQKAKNRLNDGILQKWYEFDLKADFWFPNVTEGDLVKAFESLNCLIEDFYTPKNPQ